VNVHRDSCRSRVGEQRENGFRIRGPFAECLFLIRELYNAVDGYLENVKKTKPALGRALQNLLTVHNMIRSQGEYTDVFKLLLALKHRVQEFCEELIQCKTTGMAFSEAVGDLVDRTILCLLSNPINIVMGAFLVGDRCLFDYDNITPSIDLVTKQPVTASRTAECFLAQFPYNYLAVVYKISYEIYVNKRYEMPTPEWFSDDRSMTIFHDRAREDIREAR